PEGPLLPGRLRRPRRPEAPAPRLQALGREAAAVLRPGGLLARNLARGLRQQEGALRKPRRRGVLPLRSRGGLPPPFAPGLPPGGRGVPQDRARSRRRAQEPRARAGPRSRRAPPPVLRRRDRAPPAPPGGARERSRRCRARARRRRARARRRR